MFLDTIYKEDFHNFLKNPTDFILSGVVMNENEKGYYYRFIRVPMANGEHSVEALFGQRFRSLTFGILPASALRPLTSTTS